MKSSQSSRSLPQGPFDPYLDWAIRNNFRHFRPGAWLPMLVRFDTSAQGGSPQETALNWFTRLDWLDEGLKKSVKVPDVFKKPPLAVANAKLFDFCVLFVSKNDVAVVTNSAGWQKTILSMSISPPLDLPSARAAAPPKPVEKETKRQGLPSHLKRLREWLLGRLSPKRTTARQSGALSFFGISRLGVLPQQSIAGTQSTSSSGNPAVQGRVAVAVLDEGIAFAHERFLSAANPRIEYFVNLNNMSELTSAAIQSEIANHTANGLVDEDAVYRSIGGLDYAAEGYKALARRRSHGTHVMSIASEIAPATVASQRPLIAVELPEDAVADPVANFLYAYIYLGAFEALNRAENLASGGVLPVVCNASYGPHHGPHDGTSDFEVALDTLIAASWQSGTTPLEVVLAAGNFRQSRVHAALVVAPGPPRTLGWRLQPDDLLPSFLELWFPTSAAAGITVTVTPPGGASVTVSAGNPDNRQPGPNGDVFWMWLLAPQNGSNRQLVLIAVQPTATDPPLDPTLPTAPSGLWTVTITTTSKVELEAWIGRKSVSGGRRIRGRQSYFDDPDYERFEPNTRPREFDPAPRWSYVGRRSTLSGIATGEHTRVIGGFRREPRQPDMPAGYTSSGPTSGSQRSRPAPDCLVTSEDSIARRGVLAAGTRSGCVVAMNGTSVAAPRFSRWLADAIANGPAITMPYIPSYNVPTVLPPTPPPVWPPPVVPPTDVVPVSGNGCLMTPPHPYR